MGLWGHKSSAKQGSLFLRRTRKSKCKLGLDGLFIPTLHYKPVHRAKRLMPWGALQSSCHWKCQVGLPDHVGPLWQNAVLGVSLTVLSPARSWDLKVLKIFFHSLELYFLWVFSLGYILASWINFRKWSHLFLCDSCIQWFLLWF